MNLSVFSVNLCVIKKVTQRFTEKTQSTRRNYSSFFLPVSETLQILQTANKEEKYRMMIPQLKSLIGSEKDLIANLANTAAALHQTFGFFWVGFYLVKGNELVLAPFQGPIACTRIQYGKGVCGTAWKLGETIIVPDVEKFPGHISCNSQSKSEIVVPLFSSSNIIGVLDIDSEYIDSFDETDKLYLEKISKELLIRNMGIYCR